MIGIRFSLSFRQSFVNHPTNLAELDDVIGLFWRPMQSGFALDRSDVFSMIRT